VVPEHLDWHRDAEEYFNAKSQLFRNQTADDVAIYYAKSENSEHIVSTSPGRKIPYMALPGSVIEGSTVMIDKQPVCEVNEIKLLGEHNWQNICAAVTAVWQITQNRDAIRSVLISFSGLPYRIEFRREVHDIRYYNDSYAASPPAPVAAIKAIPGKKVVIMGGFDRHLNLDDLVSDLGELDDQIRKLILIGASAQRLADNLEKQKFTNFVISTADNMPDIVLEASKLAQSGDAVVLSPGFPSFDMFKNFEDRGLRFNAAVADL
jgi:UDP-N-acetylmuramoylalanine--D-glutamate ligase